MKRVFALFLVTFIALSCIACSVDEDSENTTKKQSEHHDIVTEAIRELKTYWRDIYEEQEVSADGYFEIKNTRVITIKENDIALFHDVAYIIEFELYTDYYGSAPYYENVGVFDNVVVYKNGTMAVSNSLIRQYRAMSFQVDYSSFIKSVDDYQGEYNCIKKLN